MGERAQLPDDLAWEPDGHLSETALTCLADGEDALLSEAARAHIGSCETCAKRLGAAAMLSLSSSEALKVALVRAAERIPPPPAAPRKTEAGASPSSPPAATRRGASQPPRAGARKPLPLSAIAAALTLAVVGSAPKLVDAIAGLPETTSSFTVALPVVARSVVVILRSPEGGVGGIVSIVSWIGAAMLIVVGWLVARAAPRRKRSVEGGT